MEKAVFTLAPQLDYSNDLGMSSQKSICQSSSN